MCSALIVLNALIGATTINFYWHLNVWISMMHATLIGFDCFDRY